MSSHLQMLLPSLALLSQTKLSPVRFCFSTRFSLRNAGSQFDTSAGSSKHPKFEAFDNGGSEFRRSSSEKQRVWWSDDDEWPWEDEDDDDGVGDFGVLESSMNFSWILKVIRSLGWMVPAIIISMLVGTGPNAIIMALALPIGQSIVSLLLDTWERPNDGASVRPKPRTKKRPFTRSPNNSRVGETERFNAQTTKTEGNYESWVAADNVSGKTDERNAKSYGGWDELDKQGRTYEVPPRASSQSADDKRKQKTGRLGRRGRKRDTPLAIRLLIAVFPFLGFWIKLM